MKKYLLALMIVCFLPLTAPAQEREEELHFKPGTSSIQINRGIARGETMRFLLGARGGQTMKVVVQSVENNAVFEVIGNGGSLGQSALANGKQKWSGVIPGYGEDTIAIVVGSERGGSDFNLYVEIR